MTTPVAEAARCSRTSTRTSSSVVLDVSCAADVETLARDHRLRRRGRSTIAPSGPRDWRRSDIPGSWCFARSPRLAQCADPPSSATPRASTCSTPAAGVITRPAMPTPPKPPLQGPGRFLADYEAGLEAALCVASSLFGRLHTGQGEFIDVSQHAVLVSRADCIAGPIHHRRGPGRRHRG